MLLAHGILLGHANIPKVLALIPYLTRTNGLPMMIYLLSCHLQLKEKLGDHAETEEWRKEKIKKEKSKKLSNALVKSTRCDCLGHNAKTCKGGLIAKEKKAEEGGTVIVRHPRTRDQFNAEKAAIASNKKAPQDQSQKGKKSWDRTQKDKKSQSTEVSVSQVSASQKSRP